MHTTKNIPNHTNFLIVGSGIAGLNFALNAAKKGSVTVLTKKRIAESSTNYAQGGIASVLHSLDSFDKHIEDTLKAGAYHNDKKAVKFMVDRGPTAIKQLISFGVNFEKENQNPQSSKSHTSSPPSSSKFSSQTTNSLRLTREGGHSFRRIAFKGDYTGEAIEKILVQRVRENPNITIIENAFAVDLLTGQQDQKGPDSKSKSTPTTTTTATETLYATGLTYLKSNRLHTITADAIILATGGVGQLFKFTTNPTISTGDGIAIALRVGAQASDLEFIQFHPTALNKPRRPLFLLSEALRGEGAVLVNNKGEQFMSKYDLARRDLAPRDIVARAIYSELQKGPVYLTFTNDKHTKSQSHLKSRFPTIYKELKKFGLDLSKDKIPVVPAAHFICGGIKTDLSGRTNIKNLYAFGETAFTGVHGANRLASNSLLEAFVFSSQIAKDLKSKIQTHKLHSTQHILNHTPTTKIATPSKFLTKKLRTLQSQIKQTMWESAGIVRTPAKMTQGLQKMRKILRQISTITKKSGINQTILETKNMTEVGLKILESANKRKKSLGCHFLR